MTTESSEAKIKNDSNAPIVYRDRRAKVHLLLPGDFVRVQIPKGYELRLVRTGAVD